MNQSLRRYWSLVILGCALCLFAPAAGATRIETIVGPAVALPSPSPSPQPRSEAKRPNAVRRVPSAIIHQVTRPFRRQKVFICGLGPNVNLTSSISVIRICPVTGNLHCSTGSEVTLSAVAPDPEADNEFLFTWAVTAGRLRGEGREVKWDLSGIGEGSYTATVEMNDGNQHTSAASTTVTIAPCPNCDPPRPPCPVVSVSVIPVRNP